VAHIHLQDGSLPFEWAVTWWALSTLILAACIYLLRREALGSRRLSMAALCAAAIFSLFQVEIPVFGGVHLSLMPLGGILLGPLLGTIVALVINIFSAAIGHGGWSLIGANLLVNVTELVVAWGIWKGSGRTGRMSVTSRGAGATFAALFAGNLVMIGIVLISGIQGVSQDTSAIARGLTVLAAANLAIGAVEAVVTAYLVGYLARVRPDILGEKTVISQE